jgi:multisubunit Na+/H+ antiporter MnhE subunit
MSGILSIARPRLVTWLLRWVVLMALWMALVDSAKLAELITGAVGAALAATAAAVAERETVTRPRLRPALLREAWRPLARVPIETLLVGRALLARVRSRGRRKGRLRAVHFRDRGGRDAAGRHVLAESLGSLAPNRYVIGIDPEGEYMLVHELVRTDEPLDPMELG